MKWVEKRRKYVVTVHMNGLLSPLVHLDRKYHQESVYRENILPFYSKRY